MRPKITTSRNILRSVLYNEQKVELHHAERLTSANMLRPTDRLTPDYLLHRFQRRMELNDRVRTSLHITLNFDPRDTLTNRQMQKIAHTYMNELGFSRQPWVAWRHYDAGHPHCHIVATHVQWNGDPIDLYNIGRIQSEKARQRIEAEFNLITKEIKQQREQHQRIDDSFGPCRLIYGKHPLAKAISDIVEYVTELYKYTTLAEFNAVLRLYNVEAYRGLPGTQLHQTRGLLYRALDEHGHYIGRPLKASFFDCKPTLENLGKKFTLNLTNNQNLRERLLISAEWVLFKHPDDWDKAKEHLRLEKILASLQIDKDQQCRQVAYIDTRFKAVLIPDEHQLKCNARAIQQVIDRQKSRQAMEQNQTLDQTQTQRHRQRLRLRLE